MESSSLSVITQTVLICHSFSIHVQGLHARMLIFSLNKQLQLFQGYLEVLVEFLGAIHVRILDMLVLDSYWISFIG
jgi:hypothetical protein